MNSIKTPKYTIKLDAIGLQCPEPIMEIRKLIRSLNIDDVLYVVADDSSTITDIDHFCKFMGHKLIEKQITERPFQYWIQKQK